MKAYRATRPPRPDPPRDDRRAPEARLTKRDRLPDSAGRRREPVEPKAPRSRRPRKAPGRDLRKQYRITTEVALIASLLLLIGLTRAPLTSAEEEESFVLEEQEIVQMEEIVRTEQIERPPPPPRPPVPVEVPDEQVLEDVDLDLDATLDFDDPVDIPSAPPPPPAPEPEEEEAEPEVFVAVEQMPELVGGVAALQAAVRYPEMALRAGIEGRVVVQFVIDENGNVLDPEILRGIGGGADEEAIRAIKSMTFRPGRQRGRPVRVRMAIPVSFRLENASR